MVAVNVSAGGRWWIGGTVVLAAGLGVYMEQTCQAWAEWFQAHQFSTSLIGEAILLILAYVVIDSAIDRRTRRRERNAWSSGVKPLLEHFVIVAEHLRQQVDQLRTAPPGEGSKAAQDELRRVEARYRNELSELTSVFTASPELVAVLPAGHGLVRPAYYLSGISREDERFEDFVDEFDEAYETLIAQLATLGVRPSGGLPF